MWIDLARLEVRHLGSGWALAQRYQVTMAFQAVYRAAAGQTTGGIVEMASGELIELAITSTVHGLAVNEQGQRAYTIQVDGVRRTYFEDPLRGRIEIVDSAGRVVQITAMSSEGELAGVFPAAASQYLLSWRASVRLHPAPPETVRSSRSSSLDQIYWGTPTTEGDAPVTAFRIYRDGVAVGIVSADSRTFSVSPSDGPALYAVTASNAFGESEPAVAPDLLGPDLEPSATPTTTTTTGAAVVVQPHFAG